MKQMMWWGYLHSNNTIQVKAWNGDHADYTSDCHGNQFVRRVIPPFNADTREAAIEYIREQLSRAEATVQIP